MFSLVYTQIYILLYAIFRSFIHIVDSFIHSFIAWYKSAAVS